MKKAYTKPEIIFDDFSLATTIAAGCAVQTNTPSWNMCGYSFGGQNLFLSGIAACTNQVEDGDWGCYHVPTDTTKLFNSL